VHGILAVQVLRWMQPQRVAISELATRAGTDGERVKVFRKCRRRVVLCQGMLLVDMFCKSLFLRAVSLCPFSECIDFNVDASFFSLPRHAVSALVAYALHHQASHKHGQAQSVEPPQSCAIALAINNNLYMSVLISIQHIERGTNIVGLLSLLYQMHRK
jgi:hypothetical protein